MSTYFKYKIVGPRYAATHLDPKTLVEKFKKELGNKISTEEEYRMLDWLGQNHESDQARTVFSTPGADYLLQVERVGRCTEFTGSRSL